jgi:hypothetical protein
MKVARTKLTNIRLKSGARLFVLPQDKDGAGRKRIEEGVAKTIQDHFAAYDSDKQAAGGFAFVVWSRDGGSTCNGVNIDGCIPQTLIPDFVRARLLLSTACKWAVEDVAEMMRGNPPDPAG